MRHLSWGSPGNLCRVTPKGRQAGYHGQLRMSPGCAQGGRRQGPPLWGPGVGVGGCRKWGRGQQGLARACDLLAVNSGSVAKAATPPLYLFWGSSSLFPPGKTILTPRKRLLKEKHMQAPPKMLPLPRKAPVATLTPRKSLPLPEPPPQEAVVTTQPFFSLFAQAYRPPETWSASAFHFLPSGRGGAQHGWIFVKAREASNCGVPCRSIRTAL